MGKVFSAIILVYLIAASTALLATDMNLEGSMRDDSKDRCFFHFAEAAAGVTLTTASEEGNVPVPESLDGEMQYVEIDTMVVIYTHYYKNEEVRMDLSPADVATLEDEVEESKRFLWRSSNLKCLMKTDYLVIDRTLTLDMFWEVWTGAYWLPFWSCDGGVTSVEQDLYDAGIVDDQYSVILVLYAFENSEGAGAAYGGGCYGVNFGCMGDAAYIAIPLCWGLDKDFTITHEYLHAVDSIFDASGNPGGNDMHHADQPETFPYLNDCGIHFNFLISNVLDPDSWLQLYSQWATVMAAVDTDDDGVPDAGDLPMTETTLGSNSSDQDTDDDGLSDFEELMATYYSKSDLLEQDTDGDSLLDGEDPFPLYGYYDHVAWGTPLINGVIEADEYTETTSFNGSNADISAIIYTRWSEDVLYIAADVTDDMISTYYSDPWWCDNLEIDIDAQKDGWFYQGDKNYRFMIVPRGSGGNPDVYGHNFYHDPGNDSWHEIDVSAVSTKYALRSGGYIIEMAIPVSVMPGVVVEARASLRLTHNIKDYDTYPGWPIFNVFTGLGEGYPGFVYLYLDGRTYYVNGTTGDDLWDGLAPVWDGAHGPKKTIQAGIDVTTGGDTVVVADGIYKGDGNRDINLNGKSKIIQSENCPGVTIIDCENSARGFYGFGIPGPGAVIDGFTIENGYTADKGGGIYCEESTMTVKNCVVRNCSSVGNGGGICFNSNSNATIINCLVTGNSCGDRGGGVFSSLSNIDIQNLTATGNSAVNFGGGTMFSWGSEGTMTDSILWDNIAPEGHEIALKATANPSTLTVSYCDVEGGESNAYVMTGCTLDWGSGNIDSDALFTTGPLGDYYLSQTAAGQASDSPCVDAGSDTAENLGLDSSTTRTDCVADSGTVDMGYHSPYTLWIDSITKSADDITIHWNAKESVSYIVQWSTDLDNWMDVPVGETNIWTDTGVSGTVKFYRVREQ